MNTKLAAITGAVVAAAAYFGFFAVPPSYITSEACAKTQGQIQNSRCLINGVQLEIKD